MNTASPARKRPPWRTTFFILLCVGLCALIAVGLWPKPLPVDTAKVVTAPLTIRVTEEGKTRIRSRYLVFPPVAGFLHRVDLRAGARIEAGKTVLATLVPDASAFLTPRARAEAQARVLSTEAAIQLRQAETERARASLDLAKRNFTRLDTLLRDGAIAKQEWDTAESQVRVLERELQAASFALQVASFEAEHAKAALTQAATPGQAETLPILAPVDGYVLSVLEENARSVSASTPIMEVGDPRDLEIEVELLSTDAVTVDEGAQILIEHWGGETALRGRVVLVERGGFTKVSAIGVEEQRVKVRAELLDELPEGRTLGDRFGVQARITTWHGENVLQVPTGALFRRGMDWMVFVREEGAARLRKIEIGHDNGLAAEVRAGLIEGDVVILHPPDSLREGMRVKEAN